MSENQDLRPNWMKLNPQIDHFDPFEGIGELQEDEVRHLRYGINICDQNLLFDKTILCEASINTTVYPIPNVPSWINGMISLRGNLIPVFKIDKFLTDGRETGNENKVVFVIGQGPNAVGLSISALPVTVEINEEEVDAIPPPVDTPEIFSDCVNTAYDVNNKIWLEIDIDAVINNIQSL
jgi:twitching motility protein PilI